MRRDRYDAGASAPGKRRGRLLAALLAAAALLPAAAQHHPITADQRDTAQLVAQRGVPLDQLAPNAPDVYVVRRGDTLWAISGLYLRQPWRWPELWGMNLQTIRNPHLIYPGQTLYLDRTGGYARLRTTPPGTPLDDTAGLPTVRLSPRTRTGNLPGTALPTLPPHLIEPFLAEPLVVAEDTLRAAPRVVATTDDRVLVARGDRLYARSATPGQPLALGDGGQPRQYRIFRSAVPLKDPVTEEILGYEAQYLGRAELVRGEGTEAAPRNPDSPPELVPATLDVVSVKEEIRAGDRLLPEPPREYNSYTPHAPQQTVDARVVSLYGSNAVTFATQNQIVAINRGARDGIAAGEVLSLLSEGARIVDKTDDSRDTIKLPSEPNGLAMVFRTFDRVSYALVLDARTGVKVGDRLVNPTR